MAEEITKDELQVGAFMPPWHLPMTRDATRAIRREIELLEFFDHIGFDEAWIGEHHSGGMEIVDSPELMVAAGIERTNRLRIGTGVISLPYHHPLNVAQRIVQLDHMSEGRAMFGFGPGLLPSDALMLGVPANEQRDRMRQALDVVLRLIDGETITMDGGWFQLEEARLQLSSYSRPRPEMAIASAITPSGGRTAGLHGIGMLCLAVSTAAGYDALDVNWKIAEEEAAKRDATMDRRGLRLVAPFHVAETREQAMDEVREGFDRWNVYMYEYLEEGGKVAGMGSLEEIIENGGGVVGTPEDAIALLERYWEKSGGFGVILNEITHWADFEATKRSNQLFAEAVMPVFAGRHERRLASHKWLTDNKEALTGRQEGAIQKAIEDHFAAEAEKDQPVESGGQPS